MLPVEGDTHLDVAVVALGHKGHVDWEEVVGLPGDAELQAAGLVVGVDDGEAPLQDVSPAVVFVLPVQVADHGGSHAGPAGDTRRMLAAEGVGGVGCWRPPRRLQGLTGRGC